MYLRQLYVGGTGTVVVDTDTAVGVTFAAVPAGSMLGPFWVKAVKAASTATGIVGFA
ncbi:MAG: spike base protein, RCAP_Rcc01079 family [Serratia fonticola]